MNTRPAGSSTEETFDVVFAALADPTRRAIVRRLARGEATVLELAEPFTISLPAISRHLKVLEQAGLITRGREGQTRPCRLRPEPLVEIAAWAQHTHAAWSSRLDRLEAHLGQTAPAGPPPAVEPPTPAEPPPQASGKQRKPKNKKKHKAKEQR